MKEWDITYAYRPNSSVGRASAFGAAGRGFQFQPHHTKGVKNGPSIYKALDDFKFEVPNFHFWMEMSLLPLLVAYTFQSIIVLQEYVLA